MEKWKDIKGYEGRYQISSLGRVKSLNYNKTGKEKILKLKTSRNGYLLIDLWEKGKGKTYSVHRLVATHFIDNSNNYPQINHKDENKLNNRVENLEWCTSKYNMNYGTRNEKSSKKLSEVMKGKFIGEKSPRAKKVKCITTGEIFGTVTEASKEYNTYRSDINKCCKGILKTAGKHPTTGEKLKWEYMEV